MLVVAATDDGDSGFSFIWVGGEQITFTFFFQVIWEKANCHISFLSNLGNVSQMMEMASEAREGGSISLLQMDYKESLLSITTSWDHMEVAVPWTCWIHFFMDKFSWSLDSTVIWFIKIKIGLLSFAYVS